MSTEQIIAYAENFALTYGPKLIGAVVVWVVGSWVIKLLVDQFRKSMVKRGTDETLQPFFMGLVRTMLRVMLAISVLSMMGVAMTSFVAILGAAGLAVGLALSGSLQNFAGGVMILLFKPFIKGHVLEAQGYLGTVNEIQIFNTILKTFDNKTVIIPNGPLSTGPMVNFSIEPKRRVDMTFGIAYGDDYGQAKALLLQMISEDDRVSSDPAAPFVALSALADSSVNIVVRVWSKGSDYWGIYFDLHERVYKEFPAAGLNIPFPQMDAHVHQPN